MPCFDTPAILLIKNGAYLCLPVADAKIRVHVNVLVSKMNEDLNYTSYESRAVQLDSSISCSLEPMWVCSACTFADNSPAFLACTLCGTPKITLDDDASVAAVLQAEQGGMEAETPSNSKVPPSSGAGPAAAATDAASPSPNNGVASRNGDAAESANGNPSKRRRIEDQEEASTTPKQPSQFEQDAAFARQLADHDVRERKQQEDADAALARSILDTPHRDGDGGGGGGGGRGAAAAAVSNSSIAFAKKLQQQEQQAQLDRDAALAHSLAAGGGGGGGGGRRGGGGGKYRGGFSGKLVLIKDVSGKGMLELLVEALKTQCRNSPERRSECFVIEGACVCMDISPSHTPAFEIACCPWMYPSLLVLLFFSPTILFFSFSFLSFFPYFLSFFLPFSFTAPFKTGMLIYLFPLVCMATLMLHDAHIAGPVMFYQQHDGWSCGYRNIQMMASHIVGGEVVAARSGGAAAGAGAITANASASAAVGAPAGAEVGGAGAGTGDAGAGAGAGGGKSKSIGMKETATQLFPSFEGIPTVNGVQYCIERAWHEGWDVGGRNHFNGSLRGKKDWIGASEAAILFRSLGVRVRWVDFGSKVGLGAGLEMVQWVWRYFQGGNTADPRGLNSAVRRTNRSPL